MAYLIPTHSEQLRSELLQTICHEPLDAHRFWELRQRYSPGHFTGNLQTVKENAILELFQLTPPLTPVMQYHSRHIKSTESLISPQSLETYLNNQQIPPATVQCQTQSSIVFESEKGIEFYFIADWQTMEQTLGGLDFQGSELELIKQTAWLHHSILTE